MVDKSGFTEAAGRLVMNKGRAPNRDICDLHRGQQAAQLKVEVLAVAKVVVVADLGNEIRIRVGNSGLVGCIELNAQSGVELEWENNFAAPHNMIGVFTHGANPP